MKKYINYLLLGICIISLPLFASFTILKPEAKNNTEEETIQESIKQSKGSKAIYDTSEMLTRHVSKASSDIRSEVYREVESYKIEKRYIETSNIPEFGYWIYQPTDIDEALPMVIYLHGLDGCGDNLDKLVEINGLMKYINDEDILPNAIVVSPQCPDNDWGKHTKDIIELINMLESSENIDIDRISITGMSLGGMGTFSVIKKYPNYFAAAAPVCAKVVPESCISIKIPIQIYHGSEDTAMGFSVVDANELINAYGGHSELFMLEGEAHNIAHVYKDEEYNLINWLISQSK